MRKRTHPGIQDFALLPPVGHQSGRSEVSFGSAHGGASSHEMAALLSDHLLPQVARTTTFDRICEVEVELAKARRGGGEKPHPGLCRCRRRRQTRCQSSQTGLAV